MVVAKLVLTVTADVAKLAAPTVAVVRAFGAEERRADSRLTFAVRAAYVVVAELVRAGSARVTELIRITAALGERIALPAKAHDAVPGLAFAIGRAERTVAEIRHAIAEDVAVLARRAVAVAGALGAEADRADTRRAVVVRYARRVVAQIVYAVAEGVAELACGAPGVADALCAESD